MMAERSDPSAISSELLVAYLDGELDGAELEHLEAALRADPEVAARLASLRRSDLPYAQAFAPLLHQAPTAELQAWLTSANPRPASRKTEISRRRMAAAAVVGFLVGPLLFQGAPALYARLDPDESEGWRSAVAGYMALYSAETLAPLPSDRPDETAQLARVAAATGVFPSPKLAILPGAPFKRAQLLRYHNQPLAQLAYLDPTDGPIALCFMRSSTGAMAPRTERRSGLNVVYWSTATHSFMLIGHKDPTALKALSIQMAASLSS